MTSALHWVRHTFGLRFALGFRFWVVVSALLAAQLTFVEDHFGWWARLAIGAAFYAAWDLLVWPGVVWLWRLLRRTA